MQHAHERIEEIEALASSRAQELEAANNSILELESLNESNAKSAQEISNLNAKLQETESMFQEAQEELATAPSDEHVQEIQLKLDQTTEQLEAAQARADELQSQIQSAGDSAVKELESSQEQINKLTEALASTQSELKSAQSARELLETELKSTIDQATSAGKQLEDSTGELQTQIAELESKLEERTKQVAQIRSKYDDLSNELLKEQASSEESQSQITRLGELLDASNAREQELVDMIASLNEKLESKASADTAMSDEWIVSRRQRLDRVKSILHAQSDKVRRATEALRDRYDQCEKVLLKRAELVDAYQAISDAQAKLAKREARSGTLLGLSGLGLLLIMIAGASWFIAGQVMPGTYASRVTLVAQAGERTMSAEDLASWQGYVEQLVTDPQFVEQAAKRMKGRGITDLSVPGTLSAHMSESLDVVSAEPGKIELEYRGNGASQTHRILDTYALTLTSQANAARARRIDGALTSIQNQAQSGDAPLDTARIETAGMIFGGSSFATFLFGGIFWRRMAKAKANFERDTRVEPLFDEDSWEVEGKDN